MRVVPKNYANTQSNTLCRLLKIESVDGTVFGIANLDRDIEFKGHLYKKTGNDTSVLEDISSFKIANAETNTLVVDLEITTDYIKAGGLDNAIWELYEVDYENLSNYLFLDKGMVGNVTIHNKQSITIELLALTNKLTVNIGCVDSKRCRAVFGTPRNSTFGCGKNIEGWWHTITVSNIDKEEPDIIFYSNDLLVLSKELQENLAKASVLKFTSGKNKSETLYRVQSIIGNRIELIEHTPLAIDVGDIVQIRRDCNKTPQMCKAYGNFINYNGEPHIPTQDSFSAS